MSDFRPQRLFIITDCFHFVNNFFKVFLTFFNVVSFVFLSFPTAKIILPDVLPNVNHFFKFILFFIFPFMRMPKSASIMRDSGRNKYDHSKYQTSVYAETPCTFTVFRCGC